MVPVRAELAVLVAQLRDPSAAVTRQVVTSLRPVGGQLAEAFLPPQHRRANAHDEQDRRIDRIAKRLGAQLDAVRLDRALCDVAPSPGTVKPGARWPFIESRVMGHGWLRYVDPQLFAKTRLTVIDWQAGKEDTEPATAAIASQTRNVPR